MALPPTAGTSVAPTRLTGQPPLATLPAPTVVRKPRAAYRGRSRLIWVWTFVAVIVAGFGLGLYLTRDQLHLGDWLAQWPLVGGAVRTYQQGLQESARLAEAQRGIERERLSLQQQARTLAAEQQQLALAQQALQQQRVDLQHQAAALQAERTQLATAQQAQAQQQQAFRIYQQLRPAELAAILDTQPVADAVGVLARLPPDQAAAAIARLHPLKAARLLQALGSRSPSAPQ